MDKKTILGLVLIFAIVVGFSYLNRPSEEEVARLEAQRDSIARVQHKTVLSATPIWQPPIRYSARKEWLKKYS